MMGIAEKTIVKGRSEGAVEDNVACADFRVLVIEDEVRLRKLLVRELSAEGFEVWEAVDGKAGLQIVADGPNLVLLDLRLPRHVRFASVASHAQDERQPSDRGVVAHR